MKTHINSNQPQNFLFKPVKTHLVAKKCYAIANNLFSPNWFQLNNNFILKILIHSILKSPMHNISILVEFGKISK